MRLLIPLIIALSCHAQNAAVRLDGGVFRVRGVAGGDPPSGGWESVLQVYSGSGEVPAMLGVYAIENGELIFRPRFPLTPGMKLRAVLRGVETRFEIPAAPVITPTTHVAAVYPSAGKLPENALKLYVFFSAPMQRGDSWKHLSLLREDGSKVEAPFLELDQELWDREQRRFTILFDPGRIKRGLASLAEAGPALEAGHSYTLVISPEWRDGRNVPLAGEYRKTFQVGPADRTPPDPAKWKIVAPHAGTVTPLVITFPEAMDFALLHHEIEVAGITGAVAIARNETEWRFTPDQPWKAGEHKIVIRTDLEDLAGNHILRAFDVDVFDPITPKLTAETISLPLQIR